MTEPKLKPHSKAYRGKMKKHCGSCKHEPEWGYRGDFLIGRVQSGLCERTNDEVDIEGKIFINTEGPIDNCHWWESKLNAPGEEK